MLTVQTIISVVKKCAAIFSERRPGKNKFEGDEVQYNVISFTKKGKYCQKNIARRIFHSLTNVAGLVGFFFLIWEKKMI